MDPITFCIVIPISVPNRTCNTHKNREENICKNISSQLKIREVKNQFEKNNYIYLGHCVFAIF
jgi:hypothetical protein